MAHITVNQLFESHARDLQLVWLAGQAGGSRNITLDEPYNDLTSEDCDVVNDFEVTQTADDALVGFSNTSLIAHLSLIHPNKIQVLGKIEVQYLNERAAAEDGAISELLKLDPYLIILTEGQEPPASLAELCDESHTPLISSKRSSTKLIGDLNYYLSNQLAQVSTLHGVYMEIDSIGVLLVGKSGVGKSELALELITRGHRLIADDVPEFRRIAPDTINGTCPRALMHFLEVRGLGIINVRELYGAGAVKPHKFLRLIVRLEHYDSERMKNVDRLEGSYNSVNILGLEIPEITLPVAPGRNLAVMVECATRNHILRLSGYNSTEDFMDRQHLMMEKGQ